MQTFLPYADFSETAKVLDYRRLGKQRVEGLQLLKILNGDTGKKKGWVNHPATKMWKGHRGYLKKYTQTIINEWISRGYNNNIDLSQFSDDENTPPSWLGDNRFHDAHKSNLIRKQIATETKGKKLDKDYRNMWNSIPADLPYQWGNAS